ncbi:G-protein coupled receptor 54-like [Polyodon spathula]|uniref:G-protein coupled receptor 54-like n=1 Tax=Polyodon spathula TaxID=7913 RepID=UPI001B7ED1EE|nr:G-protein coupled receptor 54-like [Polyodon spathula]
MLDYIYKNLLELYGNFSIALSLLLTLPVTVTSAGPSQPCLLTPSQSPSGGSLVSRQLREGAMAHIALVMEHLVMLGLTINNAKSQLTPCMFQAWRIGQRTSSRGRARICWSDGSTLRYPARYPSAPSFGGHASPSFKAAPYCLPLEGPGAQPYQSSGFNGSAVELDQSPPFLVDAWLVPLFFALIMLVGLVGNSLVIYVITKHRQMRTVTNFYIANLATTDILFLVCCVPFTATLYPLPSWVFGDFMCRIVNYLQQVTAQATCITLTAMSVDRCYATVYPLQSLRHRTPRVAMAVSVGIWIGSFVLSVPVAAYQTLDTGYWYGPQTYCIEAFPSVYHQKTFILYTFLVVYLLPLVTICVCYAFMLQRMSRPVVEPSDNNYQVQLLAERSEAIRIKISKMVVVIVLLFTICWGPIQFFILFQAFDSNFQKNYETYKIKIWAHCMSYSNSSVNPIVYAFMGANFRKSFKKAFPFIFKQRVGTTGEAVVNTEMHFVSSGT